MKFKVSSSKGLVLGYGSSIYNRAPSEYRTIQLGTIVTFRGSTDLDELWFSVGDSLEWGKTRGWQTLKQLEANGILTRI